MAFLKQLSEKLEAQKMYDGMLGKYETRFKVEGFEYALLATSVGGDYSDNTSWMLEFENIKSHRIGTGDNNKAVAKAFAEAVDGWVKEKNPMSFYTYGSHIESLQNIIEAVKKKVKKYNLIDDTAERKNEENGEVIEGNPVGKITWSKIVELEAVDTMDREALVGDKFEEPDTKVVDPKTDKEYLSGTAKTDKLDKGDKAYDKKTESFIKGGKVLNDDAWGDMAGKAAELEKKMLEVKNAKDVQDFIKAIRLSVYNKEEPFKKELQNLTIHFRKGRFKNLDDSGKKELTDIFKKFGLDESFSESFAEFKSRKLNEVFDDSEFEDEDEMPDDFEDRPPTVAPKNIADTGVGAGQPQTAKTAKANVLNLVARSVGDMKKVVAASERPEEIQAKINTAMDSFIEALNSREADEFLELQGYTGDKNPDFATKKVFGALQKVIKSEEDDPGTVEDMLVAFTDELDDAIGGGFQASAVLNTGKKASETPEQYIKRSIKDLGM